jgi:hypothetical protein
MQRHNLLKVQIGAIFAEESLKKQGGKFLLAVKAKKFSPLVE